MRHHNTSDPHDALNDYLDELAGAPPADSRAGNLDSDMRDDVDRFFNLAEQTGMTSSNTRRRSMNATLPASTPLTAPSPRRRRFPRLPAWTHHLHHISTGLLVIAIIALSFTAFGPNGIGNSNNGTGSDGPSLNGAVPVATVPDDAETSSIPYPTAEECTIDTPTRDELITDIREANVATAPDHQRYERPIEPTNEESQAILQTFREWQACGWDTQGFGLAYQIQLQTPWHTANQLPIFRTPDGGSMRPVSEEQIEDYADVLLGGEDSSTPVVAGTTPTPASEGLQEILPYPTVQSSGSGAHHETPHYPTMSSGNVQPTEADESLGDESLLPTPTVAILPTTPEQQEWLPLPGNATPIVYEQATTAFPTIFVEDIVITGPAKAVAQAYFVNDQTREVLQSTPLTYMFAKVDGQWLIDSYQEGFGG